MYAKHINKVHLFICIRNKAVGYIGTTYNNSVTDANERSDKMRFHSSALPDN